MVPFTILIIFFILLSVTRLVVGRKKFTLAFCGRASLAVMLVFTGISHFTKTGLMMQMLPDFIPYPEQMIYGTGFLEILGAFGLITGKFSRITSWFLIVFFLMILPANIIGSIKKVGLGGMERGLSYLYFRIPLQLFFIAWTYYFGIRTRDKKRSKRK